MSDQTGALPEETDEERSAREEVAAQKAEEAASVEIDDEARARMAGINSEEYVTPRERTDTGERAIPNAGFEAPTVVPPEAEGTVTADTGSQGGTLYGAGGPGNAAGGTAGPTPTETSSAPA